MSRTQTRELVEEAYEAYWAGHPDTACQLLEQHERSGSLNQDGLRLLVSIYSEQSRLRDFSRVAAKLAEMAPDDPEAILAAAGGFLATGQPGRAVGAFKNFLRRWPGHPMAAQTRQTAEEAQSLFDQAIEQEMPFPWNRRFEFAALHEQVLFALSEGDHQQVIRVGEQLAKVQPNFVAVKNNLTESYFQTGQHERAIATAEEVLKIDPENLNATSNLARMYLLRARFAEAREAADRLKQLPCDDVERCIKAAEALSYLGDDDAITAIWKQADTSGWLKGRDPGAGLLLHLTAVALARTGDWRKARKLWREALRRDPDLDLVRENLEDASRSVGERSGPWAYDLKYWLGQSTIQQLTALDPDGNRRGDPRSSRQVAAGMKSALDASPHVAALVPALLNHCDEDGQRFAVYLAKFLATPETHDALRRFCQSPRGTDALRYEVLQYLSSENVLPKTDIEMFVRGKASKVQLQSFQISDEPVRAPYESAEIQRLHDEGYEALQRGDGERAEMLLRQAVQTHPDRPELQNNLAMALQLQERDREATEILEEVHGRWPDYFFGVLAMANMAIKQRRYDEAERHLQPLQQHAKLHRTEFTALCNSRIALHRAQKQLEIAASWQRMLDEYQSSANDDL